MRGVLVIAVAVAAGLVVPAAAQAYGWPVKPFGSEHPIRGGFDDPRFHADEGSRLTAFHFGVDISAPDNTPVYAVAPGTATLAVGHVVVARGGRELGYWHVGGVVLTGEHVRLHQLIGYVLPPWGHVHLSERQHGVYVDPLRRGALAPYRDTTPPVVAAVRPVTVEGAQTPQPVTGTIGLVAEAYDTSPLPPAPPWQHARLAPNVLRWRLVGPDGRVAIGWTDTISLGWNLLPRGLYDTVYAPGTYQNKANRPGRYLFWLDHALDTSTLVPGTYDVQVEATDLAGNVGRGSAPLVVSDELGLR